MDDKKKNQISNEKYLLEIEPVSTCKKNLPKIVSIDSFVYVYIWPDHVTILYNGECWQYLYYILSKSLHLEL